MEIVTEKPTTKAIPEGYKLTELGVIPEEWETKPLGEITSLMTNGYVGRAKEHYTDSKDGVLYVQGYNVRDNSIRYTGIKKVTKEFNRKNSKSSLMEGDLLTVQTGDVGMTAIVPKELEGANCHALIISRFVKEKANPKYVSYYFNSKFGRNRLKELETGTTVKHLNVGDMKYWEVPLPPTLEEQRAIAGALSDVDALIAELDALIEKKQQVKKGAMQKLLTGNKRLPGFDGEWVEKKLGDLVIRNELGGNYSNSKNKTDFPLIKMGNLDRGIINLDDLHYASNPSEVSERDRLNYGDLLFNTRNTPKLVGKVAVWRNELPKAYYNSNLMKLEFDESFIASNFFMNYTMNTESFIEKLKSIATGTTSVAAIYTRDLFTLNISVPPKDEQKAIAQILSDMDAEIQALQSKREKYGQIKQGMMQELLTGKTRLV